MESDHTLQTPQSDGESQLVEFVPIALSRGTNIKSAYILILQQKGHRRCLPVLVTEEEHLRLARGMEKQEFPTLEPMLEVARKVHLGLEAVVVTVNAAGGYCSAAIAELEGRKRVLNFSATDGVLLAVRLGLPLLVSRRLLESRLTGEAGETDVALPLGSMSEALLEEALQDAVAAERFEVAQLLSEELKRRREGKDGPEAESAEEARGIPDSPQRV